MHDPLTLVFKIRWLGVEIWHVDPEKGGDDNSCRWFKTGRPWWRHPRWHVHHWRVKVLAVQRFKRWAWSRCAACGKRFPWGYAPIYAEWRGSGPRWFRGENNVYHHECDLTRKQG